MGIGFIVLQNSDIAVHSIIQHE